MADASSSAASPPPRHVIIVGAGVAGLAAAQELLSSSHDIRVTVLEARNRIGGRILTTWLDTHPPPTPPSPCPATSKPARPPPRRHSFSDLVNGVLIPPRHSPLHHAPLTPVDLGASIIHGCGDDAQLVFRRAIDAKIRAPVVPGAGFYESTEHALWFDHRNARRLPTHTIVDVHNIFFMASRYMAAVSSVCDDGTADLQTVFDCGISYVCQHLGDRQLTQVEKAILNKICARSVGYCAPMHDMALMQASAGMEAACVDIHIGTPYEEDDPPFPGELPAMSPAAIRQQAARLSKAILNTQKPPKPMIASKRGGSGDRIVLDGYTPFLIDRLGEGVDVRFGQAVCGIAKVHKPAFDMSEEEMGASRASILRNQVNSEDPSQTAWHGDTDVHSRSIIVSTRTGDVYPGDFVIVALPLGVLKEDNPESSVTFSPTLSVDKMEAIRGMGMGVHNKVILRFREKDVFWPPKVPQLNCLDPRFQFFNLHSYGKTGVILIQVFAQSGFANGYHGLSDAGIIAEVLMVLGGMFCAPPDKADASTSDANAQTALRNTAARRRVSMLMNICESVDCGHSLPTRVSHGMKETTIRCNACGLVMHWEEDYEEDSDEEEQTTPKRPERSARLRDKAAKEREQKYHMGTENVLEEIQMGPRQRNLTWATFPAPEEYIVTRWDQDPYALGSYSYMPCGSNWQMIDQIAAPEPPHSPHPYLFFAGEHCSDLGWQCVHGAYETGIKAARKLIACIESIDGPVPGANIGTQVGKSAVAGNDQEVDLEDIPVPRVSTKRRKSQLPPTSSAEAFWTEERERALTRALIGYSDVYGNFSDVIDEMSFALRNFKKEPTDLNKEQVSDLVYRRIHERAEGNDVEAKAFLSFHSPEKTGMREEVFPKPFHEVTRRARLVGLNGSILKERYADEIVQQLRSYADAVFKNQISYRETLRKIAMMLYVKDGGLMTKRCLSEYLRTQEFGTGPQKELFLEKYLPMPK